MALGEEEDGAAHRPRLRQRPLPQWRAMSKTSPANSSSGCTGQCAVVFVSPLCLLGRWKTLSRAHSLSEGLVLHFKLMENGLLSLKVFGHLGTRLRCCAEGSTDNKTSSSRESDEEHSDSDDKGIKWGDSDSDSI